MDKKEFALKQHEDWHGKIEVVSRAKVTNREELSVAYTPGVAEPCLEISKDVDLSYKYTRRSNLVAVITDGTAVLGLGDIGPEAGMPVMEGKCALFKVFADVDAFPLCVRSKDEIVNTVKMIAGSFGGVNLEDISAPRCIEIERRLREECDIPVFHDDQHGTAVVVLASVLNALKVVGKDITEIKAVVNGAGSAGMAITRLLVSRGLKNVIMCDKYGSLYRGNPEMNSEQAKLAELTNPDNLDVKLDEAIVDADLFIGVSAPGILTEEMVAKMAKDPIVFAMANPVPDADETKKMEERAFENYILGVTENRAGEQNLTMGNNGAIIPQGIANRIIDKIRDICPILSGAEMYHVKGTLKIPKWTVANSTHDVTVGYATEFQEVTADSGKFTSIDLSGYLAAALVLIGKSVENNSEINVVDFVISKIAEKVSAFIEEQLLSGTGSSQAQGILNCANTVTAANNDKITVDDLIELQGAVKQAYQQGACWTMNNDTFTAIKSERI